MEISKCHFKSNSDLFICWEMPENTSTQNKIVFLKENKASSGFTECSFSVFKILNTNLLSKKFCKNMKRVLFLNVLIHLQLLVNWLQSGVSHFLKYTAILKENTQLLWLAVTAKPNCTMQTGTWQQHRYSNQPFISALNFFAFTATSVSCSSTSWILRFLETTGSVESPEGSNTFTSL